jgi:hypothetical protein
MPGLAMYLSGILFYIPPISIGAAVAKLGNGARFRVSSRRGSQVRILAAASADSVEEHFHAPLPGTTKPSGSIPLLRGMKMEIGCGARVRDFDGRRYFYFWHYERDNGRSERREDYVGRVDSEKARSDLLRRMAAYHRRAEQEFARRRARIEGLVVEYTST